MVDDQHYELGSVEASEQLIRDLYVDLRQKVNRWAGVTKQTAQARMGYVGQHLVSVATGYPGGRSGARGRDLVISASEFGEIKTCYRVDQLGSCKGCGARIASIEEKCPVCDSTEIDRKDDSKWLVSIRNDQEFAAIVQPQYYYLVLFEFVRLDDPSTVQASIWRVDPKRRGFCYCMIDYYLNIRARSRSKAPFNLWPYELKFYLMQPVLVYRSLIMLDGRIETLVFPGRDEGIPEELEPLEAYERSQNLSEAKVASVAEALGIEGGRSAAKRELLDVIESARRSRPIPNAELADAIAEAMYIPDITGFIDGLPGGIREHLP